ncbi:MAG: hypothetical protein ACOY4W_03735 [Thermodesulfobacteriota bacterium]
MKRVMITTKIAITGEVSEKELRRILLQEAAKRLPSFDDCGMDWFTDYHGCTYAGGPEWRISTDPEVAALVDAANSLVGLYEMSKLVVEAEPRDGVSGPVSMISLQQLQELLSRNFGEPFLDPGLVRAEFRDWKYAGRQVLTISIGRRSILIDETGSMIGAGTDLQQSPEPLGLINGEPDDEQR